MVALMERTLEVAKDKTSRQDSIRNRKWDAIHATIEKTTRKIRKAGRRSSLLNSGKATNNCAHDTTTTNSSAAHDNAMMTMTVATSHHKCEDSSSCGEKPPSSCSLQGTSPKSVISKVHQMVNQDIDLEPRIDAALSA
jgi:hypothetical protein